MVLLRLSDLPYIQLYQCRRPDAPFVDDSLEYDKRLYDGTKTA